MAKVPFVQKLGIFIEVIELSIWSYSNKMLFLGMLRKWSDLDINTYSFEVIQSGVWNSVFRDPSLIVLPIWVLEPCSKNEMIIIAD